MGKWRARAMAAALSAFWLWGAYHSVPLLASLLLKAYLFATRLPWRYPWWLLFAQWKLPVLAAFWTLVLATRAEWTALCRRAGVRLPAVWLAASFAFFALRFCGKVAEHHPAPSRYGFYPSFPGGRTYLVRSDKPSVPDIQVRTNSQGFRDKEWSDEPAPGVQRVAVVGDSVVFGYGIPDEEGLLHRRLERELNQAGRGRWEVLNLANLPSGIWYYVEALVRAGIPARPKVMVMSYLAVADLSAYDDQYIKAGLPPWVVSALEAAGVLREFMRLGGSLGYRFGRRGGAPPAELEHSRRELAALVRELERTGIPLIVWLPFGRDPLFDPYRAHPLLSFLTPTDLPEFRGSDDMAWYRDPRLSIPGDGHPTAAGNALFARGIASRVLEVSRRRPPRPAGRILP
jgi:hypothetical protein